MATNPLRAMVCLLPRSGCGEHAANARRTSGRRAGSAPRRRALPRQKSTGLMAQPTPLRDVSRREVRGFYDGHLDQGVEVRLPAPSCLRWPPSGAHPHPSRDHDPGVIQPQCVDRDSASVTYAQDLASIVAPGEVPPPVTVTRIEEWMHLARRPINRPGLNTLGPIASRACQPQVVFDCGTTRRHRNDVIEGHRCGQQHFRREAVAATIVGQRPQAVPQPRRDALTAGHQRRVVARWSSLRVGRRSPRNRRITAARALRSMERSACA